MPLDPDRASFLMAEYRVSVSEDSAVLADYPAARRLELDTNLATEAAGAALAANVLALLGQAVRVPQVDVSGVHALPAEFDGTPPTFQLHDVSFGFAGSETLLPLSVSIDLERWSTSLTLRG